MRVLLIDDEELSLEVMEIMLQEMEQIEVVGKYTNPLEALKDLDALQVNVIFLDMEMPGMHGLEFAEKVTENHEHIEVLFITAHPQFALEAFEVNAIDYLLKPVNITRLQKAIKKIEERLILIKTRELVGKSDNLLHGFFMLSLRLMDYQNTEVKWRTKKVKELFAFLWHNRKNPIHKSLIIEELWPEKQPEKAVSLLHTTIYQLRKALKEIGVENPITLVNDHYRLSVQIEADALELEELIKSNRFDSKNVRSILKLYSGDYLENDDFIWSIQYQQELKQEVLRYLQKFVYSSKSEKEHTELVGICLEKMLDLNSYDENIMYQLLGHYCELKDTRKVKEVFQVITHRLLDELGVRIPTNIVELNNNYFSER